MSLRRKLLFLSLCALMLASAVLIQPPSASSAETQHSQYYTSSIFYHRLCNVKLTGDARTDIVNIAMSQIGYVEGDSRTQLSGYESGSANYTEYGLWYDGIYGPGGFQKAAWCAMFVSWCAEQAGISEKVFYQHAYTPYGLNWYSDRDLTYSREAVEKGEYVPRPGDVIYFRASGVNRTVNHVGIVMQYKDGIIYTIEGNTNTGDNSTDGGQVCLKSYAITDTFIRYICSPQY